MNKTIKGIIFLWHVLYGARMEDLRNFEETGKCEKVDLSSTSLTSVMNNLARTKKEIVITNTNLTNVNFDKAYLKNVVFTDVNLGKADFSHSFLENVQFVKSNISHATFYGAQFNNVSFEQATLESTSFERCEIAECTFQNSNLQYVSFKDAGIFNADFSRIHLKEFLNLEGTKIFKAIINKDHKEVFSRASLLQNLIMR